MRILILRKIFNNFRKKSKKWEYFSKVLATRIKMKHKKNNKYEFTKYKLYKIKI